MGLPDDPDVLNSLKAGAGLVIYETAARYNTLSGSRQKMCGSLDMKIFDTDDYAAAAIAAAEDLYSRGVSTVLFEGGGGAASALFDAGLVDHFLYSFSPKIIGGGKPVIDGKGFDTMAQSLMLRDLSVYRVDCDILVSGYKEVYNFEML
jgi:riboflavin biosynthesis pyrimidine reductase